MRTLAIHTGRLEAVSDDGLFGRIIKMFDCEGCETTDVEESVSLVIEWSESCYTVELTRSFKLDGYEGRN